MPLHEILHACYMTLKIWEVLHVMACNLDVITCNYMHYMSLHATEDANVHRWCITLISSLLTPSGWVRKPLNYLKVRTGMYRYILLRTNMEFLYCPVPSRTGTYWYVPVRTILPNPVQGYRIPDDDIVDNTYDIVGSPTISYVNLRHRITYDIICIRRPTISYTI